VCERVRACVVVFCILYFVILSKAELGTPQNSVLILFLILLIFGFFLFYFLFYFIIIIFAVQEGA
jgi:hypothetical protein